MDRLVPDNNKELLLRLQEVSQELMSEVAEIINDDADYTPVEGEWSVKEVMCHLRDAEHIFHQRIVQMLEEDEPFLRAFNPEELAQERDYKSENWQAVINDFKDIRSANITTLSNLQPVQWLKGAIHQERGHVTIHDLTDGVVNHNANHLEQIRHVRWLAK